MSNTQNARLYVQEGLDKRRVERNERLRREAEEEEERREDLLEALFLENLSTKTRLNRIRSEQRQAPPRHPPFSRSADPRRRSAVAGKRRKKHRCVPPCGVPRWATALSAT